MFSLPDIANFMLCYCIFYDRWNVSWHLRVLLLNVTVIVETYRQSNAYSNTNNTWSCISIQNDPDINLLAPEFYIQILAQSVCKMWIIHEQKKVALWNKRHFEERNGECAACLKYSVLIFVEKIYKMQHLEGSGTPVLYIGRTVLKG